MPETGDLANVLDVVGDLGTVGGGGADDCLFCLIEGEDGGRTLALDPMPPALDEAIYQAELATCGAKLKALSTEILPPSSCTYW